MYPGGQPEDLYPSFQNCHRYFQMWADEGLFKKLLCKVRSHPLYGTDIRVKEMFYIDDSFAPAKKGGHQGATKKGKRNQDHGTHG